MWTLHLKQHEFIKSNEKSISLVKGFPNNWRGLLFNFQFAWSVAMQTHMHWEKKVGRNPHIVDAPAANRWWVDEVSGAAGLFFVWAGQTLKIWVFSLCINSDAWWWTDGKTTQGCRSSDFCAALLNTFKLIKSAINKHKTLHVWRIKRQIC